MDDVVKQCIDGRMNVFNSYNITDQAMLDKISDLTKRINEFGEGCKDAMDFNDKFMKSPLNDEYNNLVVEVAKTGVENNMPSAGEVIAEAAVDRVKTHIRPSRANIADKRDQALRDIPVVGDVMQSRQTLDLLGRFKKKK